MDVAETLEQPGAQEWRLQFFVNGLPKTAGSKKYVGQTKEGRAIIIDSSGKEGRLWRALVADAATQVMEASDIHRADEGPLEMRINFYLPRPKSHYRTGAKSNQLKPNAPLYHSKRPDALKLTRAIEDALTGIVYRDDAQVAVTTSHKVYSDSHTPIGASVRIVKV